MRFERSGGEQEPSRGHKFSILENFLSIRDFTSAMRLHFRSDLVGACLPQTLLIIRALRHEWNGVSCLHKFYKQSNSQRPVCDMQFTVVANESNRELRWQGASYSGTHPVFVLYLIF